MSKAELVAAVLWLAATLYAVFAGADFGAGVWRLLARGRDRRDAAATRRIELSLHPVWEANHVWLIFILVVLWTGFSAAFAAIMETLYIPLALAALGIVLRGAGFAFGGTLEARGAGRATELFALSSLLTPFFMGTVVGAIAAGEVSAEGGSGPLSSWIAPLPLLIGALFAVAGIYLAAVFLIDDARRAGESELIEYFRVRAIAAALVAGALAIAGVFVLRADANFIFDGLVGDGLPLLIASILLGGLALLMLWRRATRWIRPVAVGAVVTVIWGWAVAQHPYLLPETLTIEAGAGDGATLTALIVVAIAFALTVVPSLLLLYTLAQRQQLEE